MKIEIAQITTDPGRFEENSKKIISAIKKAQANSADVVIFPELTIPGYMSLDLMLNKNYLEENKKWLGQIIDQTKGITVLVGFIDFEEKLGPDGTPVRYNSAAIITDGQLVGVEDKTLLPDYDVFYENRYFKTARGRKVYEISGVKVGIEICEDLWDEKYPTKVARDLVSKGAQLLINISASPFYVGKRMVREKLIKKVVEKYNVPFVYTNLVGGQDGYDGELIYDGQSMVFNKIGELVGLGKAFDEDIFLADLEHCSKVTPPKFNAVEELHNALALGIKDYFRRTGFKKAFIGLSGGIDSAVVAALAVRALGRENVTGVGMPSCYSSKGSVEDAKKLAKNLRIDFKLLPIGQVFESFEQILKKDFQNLEKDVTEENMQARIRGVILMAFANKFGALVLSTGNKTETALGYTTLYGDMCGGLAVIADVSKLKVYDLARFINGAVEGGVIPRSIIDKAPSAELRENQTDEESLGPYKLVSPLVDEIIEDGKTVKELLKKYPKELVDKIFYRIAAAEYKRRQAPPGIKVTKKAFGIGRRVPISHGFKG
ncbi:NAD+ synthase [Candidatus Daviesbacteria bacterium]|nr:NAD+ synthase [Candidatus Daviesbacteria bacterium]